MWITGYHLGLTFWSRSGARCPAAQNVVSRCSRLWGQLGAVQLGWAQFAAVASRSSRAVA
jgi:hypothetical protein